MTIISFRLLALKKYLRCFFTFICTGVLAQICSAGFCFAAVDSVNPGDQLNVTVYNHPELSAQVKIDSRGGISLPLAGYLIVSNLELRSIDALIANRLSAYIKFPAVDVQSIGEIENIFVAGGPGGVIPFSPGETLATAIADVQKTMQHGDPQENNRLVLTDNIDHSRLDLRRIRVDRNGKSLGVFDTISMRSTGEPGPLLHANDTIVFRNKPIAVTVTGYVSKPGEAYLSVDEPLSDAIEQTGGALPAAATSHVQVTLPNAEPKSLALGDPDFAAPASNGEHISIPAAPRVEVNGLVAKPGPVALQSDFTLLGAINSAGGINKYANIKAVKVVSNGTATSYDITKLTFGDLSQNPTLHDGDSVFVPEGHKIDFGPIFSTLLGLPYYKFLMEIVSPTSFVYRRRIGASRFHRGVDASLALVALIAVSPVLLTAMLAILIEDGAPVLFAQRRAGQYERLFTMWKLRTMYARDCVDKASPTNGLDPRVTKVGRILRKFSIDELPQLINVLRGEMSIVGPRPEMPFMLKRYENWQHLRHLVRPGLTCSWQVTLRSNVPLHKPQATALDIEYIRTASIRVDSMLLARTAIALVSPKGAY